MKEEMQSRLELVNLKMSEKSNEKNWYYLIIFYKMI